MTATSAASASRVRDGQDSRELLSAGDAQLGEDAVEVRPDGAVREEELLTDLPVGETPGGELRDLRLLRRELLTAAGRGLPAALPGGPQLLVGPESPGCCAEGVER